MTLPDLIRGRVLWLAENLNHPDAPGVAACLADEIFEHVRHPDGYVPREVLVGALENAARLVAVEPEEVGQECRENIARLIAGEVRSWWWVPDNSALTREERWAVFQELRRLFVRLIYSSPTPEQFDALDERQQAHVASQAMFALRLPDRATGQEWIATPPRVTWDNPPGDSPARLREEAERLRQATIGDLAAIPQPEFRLRGHLFRSADPAPHLYSSFACGTCGVRLCDLRAAEPCPGPPATPPCTSAPSRSPGSPSSGPSPGSPR